MNDNYGHTQVLSSREAPITFVANAPKLSVSVLCTDIDALYRSRLTAPILGRCVADLAIPPLENCFKEFPRVILSDESRSISSGVWVNVLIEDELVICMFVDKIEEILDYAYQLCTVCNFPYEVCYCGHRKLPLSRRWKLIATNGTEIKTQKHLARVLSQKKIGLTLDLDFEEGDMSGGVVFQSKKTYTEVLTEPEVMEPLVKITEDAATLVYQLKKSKDLSDVAVAIGACVRSLTGRSNVYFIKDLITLATQELSEFFQMQSDGHWSSTLSDIYDNYSKCKDSELARRLKKVFNHVIMHCVYFKLNIQVDRKLFEEMEKKKVRPCLAECLTFIDAILGLVAFLLKHGRQCMIAGSLEPMFIDGDTVSEWLTGVKQLKVDFEFLGNPEAVGDSVHDFLYRLDKRIEEGKSVGKFLHHSSLEYRTVNSMTFDLDTMKKRYLSFTAASAVRKQPLGIFLYGTPGIGKSSLIEMLYDFDAKRRGRNPDPACKFQFNAYEEYMTNFKSWMHTIILDDVAQHSPSKIQGVDPSLAVMLRFINNQAECPPQAAIEDKGKTPILADLVLVTSNKNDLNIPIYYPASYAVYRRIPYRIEPIVKEQYRKPGGSSLDPSRAIHDGPYPNYWDFKVYAARPDSVGSQTGSYQPHKVFTEVSDFLEWFGLVSDKHSLEQTRWMQSHSKYVHEKLCICRMPETLCTCEKVESQGLRTRPNGDKYYVASPRSSVDLTESFEVYSDESDFSDELFNDNSDSLSRDWRPTVHKGKPRGYHFNLGYKFVSKMSKQRDKDLVTKYAFEELPLLMASGWSNDQILKDLDQFITHEQANRDLLEIEEMADILLESNRSQLGIEEDSYTDRFVRFCVTCYFSFTYVRTACNWIGRWRLFRYCFIKWFRPSLVKSQNQKHMMKCLGNAIDTKLGGGMTSVRLGLALLSAALIGGVAVSLWNKFFGQKATGFYQYVLVDENGDVIEEVSDKIHTNSEEVSPQGEEKVCIDDVEVTSQVLKEIGSVPKSAPGDERTNPWAQAERTVTSVDFIPHRSMNETAFTKKLLRNVLTFTTIGKDEGGTYRNQGSLIVLSNECLLTNNHSIPLDSEVKMSVSYGGKGKVRPVVDLLLKQSQIHRIPERDMCIITTKALPALSVDISKNFVRNSFDGVYDGFYLLKGQDGSVERREVFNICKKHYHNVIDGNEYHMEVFMGEVTIPTELGDCGSPLVVVTGYGPVVVGFHSMYIKSYNKILASKFSYEDYTTFSTPMLVEVGELPVSKDIVFQREKSYIDYHDNGKLIYHGELKGFRSRPKHHVFTTELGPALYGQSVCGHKIEKRLTGPVMDNWRPQQVALKEFIEPVEFMDEELLKRCSETFVQHVLEKLPPSELDLLHTYPIDVAVNGMPGMAYVDPIKRSTSMGYPHKEPKRKYLIPLEENLWDDGQKFTKEIEDIMEEWISLMSQGKRCHGVFSANLKDEPVSFKKFKSCKTRVFFSGPAPLLIIVRMMFMSFARVVQRNPYVFFTAVGMNPNSTQWEQLFKFLTRFGQNTTIAGDYAFFDKKIKMLLIRYAMESIIKICVASGKFSEEEITIMKVIMMELMNPTVDFFGMLITLLGGEVSGHQLTTILNCIINLLYLMYSYGKCGYPVEEFFLFVVAIILGDDHVVCVSEERPKFNHTHIKQVMLGLGVDYTMADKESESVPFINIYEATFLKRSFKYSTDLGVHVAPLDIQSIFKMLTVQVESKTICKGEQLAQAISAAFAESFFHGKEFFTELESIVFSCTMSDSLKVYLRKYPILSWDQYRERFWNTDVRPGALSPSPKSQKVPDYDSYCLDSTPILQSFKRMDYDRYLARAFPEVRIYGRQRLESKKDCKGVWNESSSPHGNHGLAKTNQELNSIQSSVPQTEGSEQTTVQQTMFVNETTSEVTDLTTNFDPSVTTQIVSSQLASFLSRPAKIATFTWSENLGPGTLYSFNPWSLYFNNANIKNKLQNFGLIRCNLKLKFTINASQFYYGSIGAFYTPLSGYVSDTTGSTLGHAPGTQVLQSQKPHVWLDPQTTSTAEMTLPFLFHRNWLSTLSLNSLTMMGKVDLTQFAALRSATGVTSTGVNIVIYAWAEDFELTAPTSQPVLQSNKEYLPNGQISGPASTVASIARRLEDAPVLGPFAKATNMVASAVSDVASYFGFTNVPNVRDVEPVKNVAFHTLASSAISEPINKLSLQPKQEVGMDRSAMGDVSDDQLHIGNFCSRESFLCGSLWSTTDAEDKVLFTSGVCPELYEKSSGTNFSVYNTPMAHAMKLFQYWRGDIIFRFKIIKTQYHRGRLNICWDAALNAAAGMPGYGNPSVMNIVFDLEDSDEVEVRVPYMQALPFMRKNDIFSTTGPYWSNGPSPTFTGSFNGVLQVRVINRLTAPEASSDVDLLVFVRAAENIEFSAPSDGPSQHTFFELQSKKEYEVVTLGEPTKSDPHTYDSVFGEKIISFRELLHRQSKAWTQVIPKDVNWTGNQLVFTMPFQRLPRAYGYDPNGWEFAKGTITPANEYAFSYVKCHPITWLANCFIGYKGSTNYNFNVVNNNGKQQINTASMGVARADRMFSGFQKPRIWTVGSASSTSQAMASYNTGEYMERQGATGMALTNQVTQAGLVVNLPYYTRSKFLINNVKKYYSLTNNGDEANLDWYEFTMKRGIQVDTQDLDVIVDIYCGTGPDFDLIFFLNCPVFTYLPAPIARSTG